MKIIYLSNRRAPPLRNKQLLSAAASTCNVLIISSYFSTNQCLLLYYYLYCCTNDNTTTTESKPSCFRHFFCAVRLDLCPFSAVSPTHATYPFISEFCTSKMKNRTATHDMKMPKRQEATKSLNTRTCFSRIPRAEGPKGKQIGSTHSSYVGIVPYRTMNTDTIPVYNNDINLADPPLEHVKLLPSSISFLSLSLVPAVSEIKLLLAIRQEIYPRPTAHQTTIAAAGGRCSPPPPPSVPLLQTHEQKWNRHHVGCRAIKISTATRPFLAKQTAARIHMLQYTENLSSAKSRCHHHPHHPPCHSQRAEESI